jgi:hypothetical protein
MLSSALSDEASAAKLEAWLAHKEPELPGEGAHALAEMLERYLSGVPNALDALTAMAKEPPFGRSVAFAAGQVLLYLVDDDDLFDDTELGALGLLDDAYLIHRCIAALSSAFPELTVPAGYAPPDTRTQVTVRSLLPAGVAEALDQTCESLVRVAAGLFSGGERGSSAPRPPRPALRVGEALACLSSEA